MKVAQALERAAARGVTCRAMVDDLGSRPMTRSPHLRSMQAAGVRLARALPIGNPLVRVFRGRIDLRNHRKIVVIDDDVTYCGSQNCADPEFRIKAKYAPMQAALCACARRGVDTTIVCPARNDSFVVAAASRSYYEELLDAGVRIFEYEGGLLHSKTLTLDGDIALVGSANMDRRSFDLDYENNVLVCDRGLTAQLRRRQDRYLASSSPVIAQAVAGWPWYRRLWNNGVAMMGPVL